MYADLHMHSTFSDGTDTPQELCNLAGAHNIRVISITDHDTVSGQKALRDEQTPPQIRVIPGIEVSTLVNHKMIHILGYYIDMFSKELERYICETSEEKTKSTRANFEKACADGIFSFRWERVLELNEGQPRISGAQVIKAMKIDEYEAPGIGLWDIFHKCFWPENDDYISYGSFNGYDAIDIIKSIGGIPVIAHPKNIRDDSVVIDLIRYGAQGLEVYHPVHDREDSKKYLQMAEDNGLYISGGSDWHGKNKNEGVPFGSVGLDHGDYKLL